MPTLPACVAVNPPLGWRVIHHELRDLDPATLAPDSPDWALLGEDLLQVAHEGGELLVDVGWYPDGRPTGNYSLKVIVGGAWEAPRLSARHRSLPALLAALDEQLAVLSAEAPAPPQAVLIAQLKDLDPAQRADAAQRLVWRGAVDALPAVMQACSRERHRPTELKLQEAVEALARARRAGAPR